MLISSIAIFNDIIHTFSRIFLHFYITSISIRAFCAFTSICLYKKYNCICLRYAFYHRHIKSKYFANFVLCHCFLFVFVHRAIYLLYIYFITSVVVVIVLGCGCMFACIFGIYRPLIDGFRISCRFFFYF